MIKIVVPEELKGKPLWTPYITYVSGDMTLEILQEISDDIEGGAYDFSEFYAPEGCVNHVTCLVEREEGDMSVGLFDSYALTHMVTVKTERIY
jgi:hypothetical protein